MADQNIFDLNAFESIEIDIQARNAITGMEIRGDRPLQICEFGTGSLVLEIPSESCTVGHRLLLRFSVVMPGEREPFRFEMTVIVDEIEKFGDVVEKARLTIVQYEEKEWERFLCLYSKRQEEIERFLNAARGY